MKLVGLQLITPRLFHDERGYFFESCRQSDFGFPLVQDNVSFSRRGTIRGLHFQSDPGQAKLVSCLQGTIWDVAVDIRPDSPTFMQWEAVELDGQSHKQLFIPVGFAHGFCVLSDTAQVYYKVSSPYNPTTERSIRWNDPELNILWPVQHPILSLKDQTSPFFSEVRHVVDHRG